MRQHGFARHNQHQPNMFKRLLSLLLLLVVVQPLAAQLAKRSTVPGQSLYVSGVINTVYVPPSSSQSVYAPASASSVVEISWKHDDGSGWAPRTVRVKRERLPGQSFKRWMKEFHEDVQAMMAMYPPNVDPSADASVSDSTFEITWLHDPDGDGPLKPVTVVSRIEKSAGESSAEAARRLKQQTEELFTVYPPNVDAP